MNDITAQYKIIIHTTILCKHVAVVCQSPRHIQGDVAMLLSGFFVR